ncbi:MAG TPA: heavy metal translocating P-type ATPase [Flexilinea sp.]|nr:heavy metal translocating P-type ATPase [Flexilinea sp.]
MGKQYKLSGLSCPVCAFNIEQKINEIPGVRNASVNFATQTLEIETESENEIPLFSELEEIIRTYEPETTLKEYSPAENSLGKEERKPEKFRKRIITFVLSAILAIAGSMQPEVSAMRIFLFLLAYLIVGIRVIRKAINSIRHGNWFDENFLMSIASIGAIAIGEFPEAIAVMIFYEAGELLQELAVDHSRKSIASLMNIRPDYANLVQGDGTLRVNPADVKVGDLIQVKAGERIPLDGIVEEGHSMLDTSALTGESVPREVFPGDRSLSGSINQSGVLTIRVNKTFGESTVNRILDMVENASEKKAATEQFITKFSKVYTPIVIALAFLIAVIPPLISGDPWNQWLYRGLVFLVISCPCALVISIPLGFIGGIGKASKKGILVKGSNYLEALNNVSIAAFDKTGTLTKGTYNVTKVLPASGFSENYLLETAAYAEAYATHPIAKSILRAYGKEIDFSKIEEVEEIAGQGIRASIQGEKVLIGNRKMMEGAGITPSQITENGTVIDVAVDGIFIGSLIISDEVKADSLSALKRLKALGVKELVMLTGDKKSVGEEIGKKLGIDRVYSELLPDQKVEIVEQLLREKPEKTTLMFVGDGMNDAPVLALADIGVAMGKLGSDAAIEAADVVILTDEPSRLPTLIEIARKTHHIVGENILLAISIKVFIMIFGAAGIANMWMAVFADVGVMLVAVLNSLRILR